MYEIKRNCCFLLFLFQTNYMFNIKKLGLTSTTVVVAHYFIIFPLLIFYYVRILRQIKQMRKDNGKILCFTSSKLMVCNNNNKDLSAGSTSYGATNILLFRGHSQAKRRVILFLTVFVIGGFFSKLIWSPARCRTG